MLSVLIPAFNYNVFPLVLELQKQCESCGIEYEIIVLDDCSTVIFSENNEINTLQFCLYLTNENNTGRASNINKLVDLSKFEYILILEADAFPSNKNYIQLYVDSIATKPEAVFGGVIYSKNKPPKKNLLRWVYGNAREFKNLNNRIRNPFDIVFSWNLLLNKKIFLENSFDSEIKTYGFEDLVFLKQLKKNKVAILQIDNPLIHQNEEESTVFIEKSKIATLNLIKLYQNKILTSKDSKLLQVFDNVQRLNLTSTISFHYTHFENAAVKNLLSEKPSLFLFDLFRLGYFCQNYREENLKK